MGRGTLHVGFIPKIEVFALLGIIRADFADASCIQELLAWDHPHVAVVGDDFQFIDDEKMTMLRLPRKECMSLAFLAMPRLTI